MVQTRILRLPVVMERVGISRSSIYKFIAAGTFPKPVQLGPRSVGWLETEIDEWIAVLAGRRRPTVVREPTTGRQFK